jgi:hypothetical protein
MANKITKQLLADLYAGAANASTDSVDIYPETLALLVREAKERGDLIEAMEKVLGLSLDHGQLRVGEAQEIVRGAFKALKVDPRPELAAPEAEVASV